MLCPFIFLFTKQKRFWNSPSNERQNPVVLLLPCQTTTFDPRRSDTSPTLSQQNNKQKTFPSKRGRFFLLLQSNTTTGITSSRILWRLLSENPLVFKIYQHPLRAVICWVVHLCKDAHELWPCKRTPSTNWARCTRQDEIKHLWLFQSFSASLISQVSFFFSLFNVCSKLNRSPKLNVTYPLSPPHVMSAHMFLFTRQAFLANDSLEVSSSETANVFSIGAKGAVRDWYWTLMLCMLLMSLLIWTSRGRLSWSVCSLKTVTSNLSGL